MARIASIGALALVCASEAQAAADCRRIPVYSAPCFSQIKLHRGCAPIPPARAPCFAVHGRLAVYNGSPSFRLSPLRSHRILGVLGGDGDAASPTLLPAALRAAMTPAAPGDLNPVTGDFRVCPLATERAGWMQLVCIVSASRVSVVPTSGESPPPPAGRAGSRSRPAPG
ncbi:MAG TPA: hypothetical protein VKS60_05995 [Stellaceae bacterium]|nr:hypothetical protein [Stellaceae bacterium]